MPGDTQAMARGDRTPVRPGAARPAMRVAHAAGANRAAASAIRIRATRSCARGDPRERSSPRHRARTSPRKPLLQGSITFAGFGHCVTPARGNAPTRPGCVPRGRVQRAKGLPQLDACAAPPLSSSDRGFEAKGTRMGSHGTRALLALACAGVVATTIAGDRPRPVAQDEVQALLRAGEAGAFARKVQAQNERLRIERSHYPAIFKAAYARYPAIPAGTLEALAFAQSRWHTLRPDRTGGLDHPHMPPAWGVMGLYAGGGFADQVGEAAALLRTTPERVKTDPLANVLGAAALLDQALRTTGTQARDPAALAPALQRYAGFGAGDGQIASFARAAFARDVLQALDFGVNDNGIRVPERAVEWERAFPADMLTKLRAPMVRLDAASGQAQPALQTEHFRIDPLSGVIVDAAADDMTAAAVDFPGATWDASPNYNSRSGVAVREVIQHTTEGSFAGAISWFNNPDSNVSAHYVISSSGQVVQMVREADRAWHAGDHNSHSIGIEHAGYANDPGTWTSAILEVSSAITRQACARYAGVACTNAVRGSPSPTTDVAESIAIKGHGMISGASRSDPGPYFGWERYYGLINPATGGGTTTILDGFESSVGHFTSSPSYSGSTTGISSASTSARTCASSYAGACSLNVTLVDNAGSSAAWAVRHLSGAGNPGSNTGLARSGRIGFYVYSGGSGMSVGVGIDDSDGTERSVSRTIPANTWTYVEWGLSDTAQWNAWAGGNGAITASTVHLDAIWFYRAQTSYDVQLYVDNVQLRN